jgi:16S rRNA G1207 methylase RsmC
MSQVRSNSGEGTEVPPYPQEALLIDAIPRMSGDRLICTSAGLAQFACAAARALRRASVSCTYLDLYRANLASTYWQELPRNLRIGCATDLPNEEADVVAFPFSAGGEAELTRDLIQAGHERLRLGGKMYATTDNAGDAWLHQQLSKSFKKLERQEFSVGAFYVGTKTEPLKKIKNFACEFAFRDRGRLIRAYSRPGVFSHRHIDPGARRLIDEMQVDPGARVLDVGCGAGTVALAAVCRAHDVTVHAVDSNARAVQCTQRGAELNTITLSPSGRGRGEGVLNLTTELNATGNYVGVGTYDLALANPPYYASFRIAEHFLAAGRAALRPAGRILVVTKHPNWYQENMAEWFDDVTITERKNYYVAHGVRPAGDQ